MNAEKSVALGLIATAVLYLIYASGISVKTISILTQSGLTPRTVPVILGISLLLLAALLALHAFRTPADAQATTGDMATGLVLWTVVLSTLYVLLIRPVGFIITTSSFLFILVSLGRMMYRVPIRPGRLVAGILLNGGLTVGLYWLNRVTHRGLLAAAKQTGSAFLSSPYLHVTVLLLLTGAIILLGFQLLKSAGTREDSWVTPAITALGTTQVLYLIFRQVFLVSLPNGLLQF